MENAISSKKFMALFESKQWLSAISLQGQRLLEIHTKWRAALENLDIELSHKLHEQQRIEEYFFLIATNKARVWLIETNKLYPQLKTLIGEFNNQIPLAKEVRDMREHEIGHESYLDGKGYEQNKFIRDVGLNPGEFVVDATSTLITKSAYLIGGRLDVQKTMTCASNLHTQVVDFFKKEVLSNSI